jgi:hypothetical protein
MEQLPTWLTAAVLAAGMTAYADDLDHQFSKDTPTAAEPGAKDEPTLPLH